MRQLNLKNNKMKDEKEEYLIETDNSDKHL